MIKKLLSIGITLLSLTAFSTVKSTSAANSSFTVSSAFPRSLNHDECFWVSTNGVLDIKNGSAIYSTLDGYFERLATITYLTKTNSNIIVANNNSTLKTVQMPQATYGNPSTRDISDKGTSLYLVPSYHAAAMNFVWQHTYSGDLEAGSFNPSVGDRSAVFLLPKTKKLPLLDWYQINTNECPLTESFCNGVLSSPIDMPVEDDEAIPAYKVMHAILQQSGVLSENFKMPEKATDMRTLDNQLDYQSYTAKRWCDFCNMGHSQEYITDVEAKEYLDVSQFNNAGRYTLPLLGDIALSLDSSSNCFTFTHKKYNYIHAQSLVSADVALPEYFAVIYDEHYQPIGQGWPAPSFDGMQVSEEANLAIETDTTTESSMHIHLDKPTDYATGTYVVWSSAQIETIQNYGGLPTNANTYLMIDIHGDDPFLPTKYPNTVLFPAYITTVDNSEEGFTYEIKGFAELNQFYDFPNFAGFKMKYPDAKAHITALVDRRGQAEKTVSLNSDYSHFRNAFTPWKDDLDEKGQLMYVSHVQATTKSNGDNISHNLVKFDTYSHEFTTDAQMHVRMDWITDECLDKLKSYLPDAAGGYPINSSNIVRQIKDRLVKMSTWSSAFNYQYDKIFLKVDDEGNTDGTGIGLKSDGSISSVDIDGLYIYDVNGGNGSDLDPSQESDIEVDGSAEPPTFWLYKSVKWKNYLGY